ncbi:hypothetical protein Cs7R123_62550 [Catellatospora sp. TT07R-123]|uniref:WD40 repeat domain-containing protein n=1 Tax=Catellatospora sp. TT07R-123 TaxID=2733863 RepID=UPI001B0CACF0|nr:WD40 repeat domain-containing protein [Catellatospora sp. TT07R-123]GHJ48913.1 hypothetical protein Cs7R123_62550 [Catellatospora sp. TT07R-123]
MTVSLAIDEVPWARLRTSTGTGGDLPGLLTTAADPGADVPAAQHALDLIESRAGHCGMISEAGAHLPRVLALIARRPEPAVRDRAVDLLETIAFASPASAAEAGDRYELPFVLRRELVACLPDLRAVDTPDARRLVGLIASGQLPGGVVAEPWRDRAGPFLGHHAHRLFPVTVGGRALIVATSYNAPGGIGCWDAATGEQVGRLLDGVAKHVYVDDGDLVVAGVDPTGRAMRRRLPSGRPTAPLGRPHRRFALRRPKPPQAESMTSYREDGGPLILVTGDRDGVVQRWDAATGLPVGEPVRLGDRVSVLWPYELDGAVHLAAGGWGGGVWRWRPGPGQRPLPVAGKHHQLVLHGAAYTVDGRTVLATGATDNAAYRWDAETGEQLGDMWLMPELVGGICPYPVGGRLLVAVGGGFQIQRFDAVTGERFGDLLHGHQEAIVDTCYAEVDGRPMLFSCDNFSVWRWDAVTGQPLPPTHP